MSNVFKGLAIILNIFVILKQLEFITKDILDIPYKWKFMYSCILCIITILFYLISEILEVIKC